MKGSRSTGGGDLPYEPGAPEPEPARERKPWGALVLQSCLSVLLLSVVILLVALMWASGWNLDRIRQNVVQRWTDKIWRVNLEESFRAETLRIASTHGNELTLVTHERREVFERKTVGIVPLLNRPVPFTDRKTTVAFPATYRYHVLLNDPWSIETEGETVVIRAPRIRATLPVAFDSGKVETETEGWWFSGGRAETDKEALKIRITEKLGELAQSKDMIDAVRDPCRESLAKFVQTWLLREDYWREGRFTQIKVIFPDETKELLDQMEPALRLEKAQDGAAVKLEPAA